MGTSTRPRGPRTGLVTPGCYAAALGDCDGNPTTKEHYVSKNLLKRFGGRFFVDGVSTLAEKILCLRHNKVLSPLDTMIGNFYDVIAGACKGCEVGAHPFEGEDLERWALKMVLGYIASGNVRWHNGSTERPEIPLLYLRILFGEEDMPDGLRVFLRGRSRRRLGRRSSQRRHQQISDATHRAWSDLRRHRETGGLFSIRDERDGTARSCEAANLASARRFPTWRTRARPCGLALEGAVEHRPRLEDGTARIAADILMAALKQGDPPRGAQGLREEDPPGPGPAKGARTE